MAGIQAAIIDIVSSRLMNKAVRMQSENCLGDDSHAPSGDCYRRV